jgi:hypothetical protein
MIAIATLDRGPEALGRMHQALGSQADFGEGTASAFFEEASSRQRRRMPVLVHHPHDRDQ